MIRPLVLLVLAAAALLTTARTSPAQDRLGPSRLESHLQYRGFGIFRWTNPAWTMRRPDQIPTRALIYREPLSVTHTAYVSVTLATMKRPATSAADFAALVKKRGLADPRRHRMISDRQTLENYHGQWAARYETRLEDRDAPNSPGKSLILRNRGIVINHPAFPGKAIEIEFSERGLPSEIGKRTLEAEADDIIRRVQLEMAPNRPL